MPFLSRFVVPPLMEECGRIVSRILVRWSWMVDHKCYVDRRGQLCDHFQVICQGLTSCECAKLFNSQPNVRKLNCIDHAPNPSHLFSYQTRICWAPKAGKYLLHEKRSWVVAHAVAGVEQSRCILFYLPPWQTRKLISTQYSRRRKCSRSSPTEMLIYMLAPEKGFPSP